MNDYDYKLCALQMAVELYERGSGIDPDVVMLATTVFERYLRTGTMSPRLRRLVEIFDCDEGAGEEASEA
jgi:hypothetical protein